VRARANVRALMTLKSCAVGMRNAIPRNHLNRWPLNRWPLNRGRTVVATVYNQHIGCNAYDRSHNFAGYVINTAVLEDIGFR